MAAKACLLLLVQTGLFIYLLWGSHALLRCWCNTRRASLHFCLYQHLYWVSCPVVLTLVLGYVPAHGSREEMETGNTISEFSRVEVRTCSKTRFTPVCVQDKTMSTDWVRIVVEAGCGVSTLRPTYIGWAHSLLNALWWVFNKERRKSKPLPTVLHNLGPAYLSPSSQTHSWVSLEHMGLLPS